MLACLPLLGRPILKCKVVYSLFIALFSKVIHFVSFLHSGPPFFPCCSNRRYIENADQRTRTMIATGISTLTPCYLYPILRYTDEMTSPNTGNHHVSTQVRLVANYFGKKNCRRTLSRTSAIWHLYSTPTQTWLNPQLPPWQHDNNIWTVATGKN